MDQGNKKEQDITPDAVFAGVGEDADSLVVIPGSLPPTQIELAKTAIIITLKSDGAEIPESIENLLNKPTFGIIPTRIQLPKSFADRILLKFQIGDETLELKDVPFFDRFGLPHAFKDFEGRQEFLQLLESNGQNTATSQNIQVVSGTGGIGKTQLAVTFAHRKLKQFQETQGKAGYRSIIWFVAGKAQGTDNQKLLLQQFQRLGQQLGIESKQNNLKALINLIFELLDKKHGPYLVIFDNAPNLQSIKPFFPPSSVPIIITTRNNNEIDWDPHVKTFALSVFTDTEALLYIKKVLSHNHTNLYVEREAKALAEALGYFPLALSQALAYITTENIRIKDFLEEFTQQKMRYFQHSVDVEDPYQTDKNPLPDLFLEVPKKEDETHEVNLWAVMQSSLKKVTSVAAMQVLNVCTYLAPEEPIDLKLLELCAESGSNFSEVIAELRRDSLVEAVPMGRHVRIHHMVQQIVSQKHDRDAQKKWLSDVAEFISRHYEREKTLFQGEDNKRALLFHSKFILKQVEAYSHSDARLKQTVIKLRSHVDKATKLLGNETALVHLIAQLLEVNFPPNPEQLVLTAERLITIELHLEALSLLDLIPEDEISVTTLCLKAHCQLRCNEFVAASDTILMCQGIFGDNDDYAKQLFTDISLAQQQAKQWEADVHIYRAQDSLTITDQIKLALNLRRLKRFEDALVLLQKIISNNPGPDLLAVVYYNQAQCYFALQRYQEAQESVEKSFRLIPRPEVQTLNQKIILAIEITPQLTQLLDKLAYGSKSALNF